MRNRSVVSKHLYAGSGRIVTHLVMGTAPGNEGRGAPGNGHGSDKTPTKPETGNGNSGNANANNGQDKEKGNNGVHLGQFKKGRENPGQGRDRRSDTANLHAQDVYKNPTLTGEMPGQGRDNRSEQAAGHQNVRTSPLVITGGEASVELGGDTSGGETVVGVTETGTPTVNGQSEFIWYYHPDHLGSTGFVTDQNGELYEHVEYFPFGETWVQEHSNTQRTPYLYTGKELDEETGLYYYGARYYDPRTSVWASADPILGDYIRGERGTGGVFNPLNLGLYAYAHLNTLRFVDPDGNESMSEVQARMRQGQTQVRGVDGKNRVMQPIPEHRAPMETGELAVVVLNVAPAAAAAKALGAWAIGKLAAKEADDFARNVITDNRATKIFGKREGHLRDTPENRKLLEDVANDKKAVLGPDDHGNTWSARNMEDGAQVWTQTRNGEIINGGLNKTPHTYNPRTGLSAPVRPNWE